VRVSSRKTFLGGDRLERAAVRVEREQAERPARLAAEDEDPPAVGEEVRPEEAVEPLERQRSRRSRPGGQEDEARLGFDGRGEGPPAVRGQAVDVTLAQAHGGRAFGPPQVHPVAAPAGLARLGEEHLLPVG
jgi:hypothetical protein